ncbi:MAG: DUF2079 domain-containing protein [Vulcanimicrobiota bacterium]
MGRALGLCMLAYWVLFSLWSWALHRNLDTGIFDLGIHCQAMWLFSQGLPDFLSTRGMASLADHFTPILFLLSPLANPWLALCFQSAALASAAWPIYQLGRRELAPPDAFWLALAYLLQPGLWSANLFDFHASSLALATLSWALWALHAGRPWIYWPALLLTLGEGEALGVTVCLLSLEAWRSGRRRTAVSTAALGLLGIALAASVMNAANGGQPSQYRSLFAQPNLDPLSWLTYLLLLLLPLFFLPLWGWPRLLPALPVILANCLSWREGQRGLDHHYLASILPFLMWAAAAGLRGRRAPRVGLLLLLVANLLMHRWLLIKAWQPHPYLPGLPGGASLSADNGPGAHFCLRQNLFLFPNPFQPMCWGNRAQAMVETVGKAGQPPLPGLLRRRLQECAVDYILLSPDSDSWPLRPADKAYWIRELRRSGLYREMNGRLFQRQQPGPLRLPVAEPEPRLSSDGAVLVYADAGGVFRQRRGEGPQRLGSGFSPEVSADGSEVLFISEETNLVSGDRNCSADAFLWRAGSLKRLGPDRPTGQVSAYWAGFSPSGQPLVLGYGSERKPPQAEGLWIGPLRGGWGTRLEADGALRGCSLTGARVAGMTPQSGGGHLIHCALSGLYYQLYDDRRALSSDPLDHIEPSLSQDGHWLAYNHGGQIEVWSLADGRRWSIGPGCNPCLSGDGHWLAYYNGSRVIWRKVW